MVEDIEQATAEFNNIAEEVGWSTAPDNKPQVKWDL
jgi:hypothetical protein